MFLTAALFALVSVALAAAYVLFIHETQVREAARKAYITHAEEIATIVSEAPTDSMRARALTTLSGATQLHVVVIRDNLVVLNSKPEGFESTVLGDEWQLLLDSLHVSTAFYESRRTSTGERRVLTGVTLPHAGLTVGIEQMEAPLHTITRRMSRTLLVGMGIALMMAVISSWVAADKVTTPLLAIGKIAKNITAGRLDTPIRVETRAAEIQDLAANLDQMAVNYRAKITEMERLTRLQSEFIGNVSHEVRNPIFSISGYLEALGSPGLPDAKRERFAEKGLLNLARLGNLFESLIEIARLEYREDWIDVSTFDIMNLAGEVVETLRPKAAKKGLALSINGSSLSVNADRDRIRRVLVNLLENAIVYSDYGEVRCQILRQNGRACVEVIDNGRGISEEHQERIFERFFRVDPDRSRKSGGAGLGLSIVKQILHAHKESIFVESVLGQGTRFWFELPCT